MRIRGNSRTLRKTNSFLGERASQAKPCSGREAAYVWAYAKNTFIKMLAIPGAICVNPLSTKRA